MKEAFDVWFKTHPTIAVPLVLGMGVAIVLTALIHCVTMLGRLVLDIVKHRDQSKRGDAEIYGIGISEIGKQEKKS